MKYEELYIAILNEELKKAMGCTEPIAISYLSCVLKDLLESNPDKVDVFVSGSILKNVKSVVCYGETKDRIEEFCKINNFECHKVDNLKEAVNKAYDLSRQ